MTKQDKTLPDVAIFPDLNITVRTPAGRTYRGKVLMHDSQHAAGESWLQIMALRAVGKDEQLANALLAQNAKKHGRPAYFAAESTLEPMELAFNRIPAGKRTAKNADTLIGELWDADGLWTLLIKPSKSDSVLFAGSVVPARRETDNNPDSKIAQYQRPATPDSDVGSSTRIAKEFRPA